MTVDKLRFPIRDEATKQNLDRLDHLSQQRCDDGSFQLFETYLLSAIGSLRLLPSVIGDRIRGASFLMGNAHVSMSAARRTETWSRLAMDLRGDLQALASDEAFWLDNVDRFADRPRTKGERILEICDALDETYKSGGPMDHLAKRLEIEGAGSPVSTDAKQLVRLVGRKRIPNWDAHQSEIVRLVHHTRLIAERLHHME